MMISIDFIPTFAQGAISLPSTLRAPGHSSMIIPQIINPPMASVGILIFGPQLGNDTKMNPMMI